METSEAIKMLLFSGSLSVFFAILLGFAMLIPLQPWGRKWTKGINMKQFGAAHLDWIMLGLMQAAGALLIMVFTLKPASWLVWALVAGGWLNPLPYVFRAIGINAFAFAGGMLQRATAALGGISATLILVAWGGLLWSAWAMWP